MLTHLLAQEKGVNCRRSTTFTTLQRVLYNFIECLVKEID